VRQVGGLLGRRELARRPATLWLGRILSLPGGVLVVPDVMLLHLGGATKPVLSPGPRAPSSHGSNGRHTGPRSPQMARMRPGGAARMPSRGLASGEGSSWGAVGRVGAQSVELGRSRSSWGAVGRVGAQSVELGRSRSSWVLGRSLSSWGAVGRVGAQSTPRPGPGGPARDPTQGPGGGGGRPPPAGTGRQTGPSLPGRSARAMPAQLRGRRQRGRASPRAGGGPPPSSEGRQ
jgi:hypothetical protein